MGRLRFFGRSPIADRLTAVLAAGHAGQPYLFVGPAGSGKETTALEIARRVNCAGEDRCSAEELCESCVKATTFQHPDIRWLGPAPASIDENQVRELLEGKIANPFAEAPFAASSQVLIGDPERPGPLTVRALVQFLRRQAFQGRWKAAVVADAHRLNASAANAFLKTLEEPPPRTLIILCAPSTAGMLPTILSRCQKVGFDPYPEGDLARVLTELVTDRPEEAAAAARLADGDARRGVALLEPEARALRQWAVTVFDAIQSGRIGEAHLTAERLHQGIIPAPPDGGGDDAGPVPAVKDLASKRQRALRFCEFLTLLYGETVACRERGDEWQPRIPTARDLIERAAGAQPTRTLLAGIARLDVTKHEIDGNLNLGLATAALLQELCDDAQRDRQPARA